MKTYLQTSISLLCLLALTACAPTVNPTLDRVESKFEVAQSDPNLIRNAPLAFAEAQEELARAQEVWRESGDSQETQHRAYLADQKLTIAELKSRRELEEQRRAELTRDHSEALARLRGEELRHARMRSEYFEDQTLRLMRELREFRTQRTNRGIELTLSDVLFETDQSVLKPGATQKLEPLVSYLKYQPERVVTIEGHTDSSGSAEYNRRLSQERADAVKSLLVYRGVAPSRITAIGLGEQFPVTNNETSAGRLQNRRVQVVVK